MSWKRGPGGDRVGSIIKDPEAASQLHRASCAAPKLKREMHAATGLILSIRCQHCQLIVYENDLTKLDL